MKYKKEVIAAILFAVFSILSVAFLSFNPHDPSWFYFSSDAVTVTNWAGRIGANISAFFFYYLGSASYILLFILLFFAYVIFFKKEIKENYDRFFALVLLLFASSTLLKSFSLDISSTYPGGWIGSKIYNLLQPYFGFVGIQILIFVSMWISFTLAFRFSFFNSLKVLFSFLKKIFFYLVSIFVKMLKFVAWYLLELLKAIWCKIKSKIFKKGGRSGDSHEWEEYKKCLEGGEKEERVEKLDSDDDILNSLQDMVQKKDSEHFFASVAGNEGNRDIEIADENVDNSILPDNQILEIVNRFANKKIVRFVNTALYKNIFTTSNLLTEIEKAKENTPVEHNELPEDSKKRFTLPDLSIFEDESKKYNDAQELKLECETRGKKLEEKLSHFGIGGKVTSIKPGPVVTLFEFMPEIDSKISKIIALEDDLAMALTAMSIRIIAPIPGKSVVGFEISNYRRNSVLLSDLMLTKEFEKFHGNIPLGLGVDIVGNPVIEDLVYMPHLLVAGSTGSGKSVGLNAMLIGLLCKLRPDQLKLILIDPKRLEFAPYADIPHLLFPIITNPRQAAPVLKWVVQEMETRYERMAEAGVRNVLEYQKNAKDNMPFIVIMIDELADLMMVAGKDVEMQIARIAQMARAAGIHMIVATQRPSVDVVTGLIKVNFPSRIAFRVSSKIDSRTIVDSQGAEKLLGRGDMLYLNSTSSDLKRIHGAYISDKQIEKLTMHLKLQQKAEYLDLNEELKRVDSNDILEFDDNLYGEIIEFVKQRDEISISMIQRQYRIGFNRSARIIERLEMDGLIAPAQGSKPRKVLC